MCPVVWGRLSSAKTHRPVSSKQKWPLQKRPFNPILPTFVSTHSENLAHVHTSLMPFSTPSFDDSGDQPLVFDLTVTDSGGLQSSDSTNVSVSNFEKDNPGASGGGCFIDTAAYGLLTTQ